jgi:hypothetical protein
MFRDKHGRDLPVDFPSERSPEAGALSQQIHDGSNVTNMGTDFDNNSTSWLIDLLRRLIVLHVSPPPSSHRFFVAIGSVRLVNPLPWSINGEVKSFEGSAIEYDEAVIQCL